MTQSVGSADHQSGSLHSHKCFGGQFKLLHLHHGCCVSEHHTVVLLEYGKLFHLPARCPSWHGTLCMLAWRADRCVACVYERQRVCLSANVVCVDLLHPHHAPIATLQQMRMSSLSPLACVQIFLLNTLFTCWITVWKPRTHCIPCPCTCPAGGRYLGCSQVDYDPQQT